MQRSTGETLLEHLRPRLFEPLGLGPATWETCPRGINTGGWGGAGVPDMQAVLDLVWEHLLDDASAPSGVLDRALPPVRGAAGVGFAGGRYRVAQPRRSRPEDWRPSHEQPPTIRAVAFEPLPGAAGWRVTIEDETGTHEHVCPDGEWHVDGEVASSGGWTGRTGSRSRCATSTARSCGPTAARSTAPR